jgi:hypothetical protein
MLYTPTKVNDHVVRHEAKTPPLYLSARCWHQRCQGDNQWPLSEYTNICAISRTHYCLWSSIALYLYKGQNIARNSEHTLALSFLVTAFYNVFQESGGILLSQILQQTLLWIRDGPMKVKKTGWIWYMYVAQRHLQVVWYLTTYSSSILPN